MAMTHVRFVGLKEHPGEIAGRKNGKTSFSPRSVFLLSRNPQKKVLGLGFMVSLDW